MALELGIKLSANTSGFTAAVNNASKALSDTLAKSIVDAKTSLNQLDPAIQQAVQGIDLMNFDQVSAAMQQFVNNGELLSSFLERVKSELGSVDDNQAFTELSNVIKMAEDQLKSLSATENNNTNTTKSLRTQLREMNQELTKMDLAGQKGSDAYNELAAKAGKLKDAVRDAGEQINTMSSDTLALDAGVGIIQNLTAAFQVYEGVMALTGANTEDAQKSMQKLMAVMSIAQGIQQLGNFITGQSAAKKAIDTAATYVQSTAYRVLTVSLGAGATAARIFSAAIAATGVGALIVGLSIAISKLMDFASSADKAKEAQDALQASLDYEYAQTQRRIKLFENKTKLDIANAKARGASEKELQDIEERGLRQRLGALTTLVRDQKASGTYIKRAEEDLVNAQLELDVFLADQKAGNLQLQIKNNKEALDQQNADQKKYKEQTLQNQKELYKELDALKKANLSFSIAEIESEIDARKSAGIKVNSEEETAFKYLQQKLFALKKQELDTEYNAQKAGLIKLGALTTDTGRQALEELEKQYNRKVLQLQVDLKASSSFNSADISKGVQNAFGGNKIEQNLGFSNQIANALGSETEAAKKSIEDFWTNIGAAVENGVVDIGPIISNAIISVADTFGSVIAQGGTFGQAMAKAGENILKIVGSIFQDLGRQLIFAGKLKLLIDQTLTKMFGPQGGPLAIAAGFMLLTFGSLMKNIKLGMQNVKAFAAGGIVTGPTMGLVGEAGREAIIPLNRIGDVLGSIGGTQSVFVTGQLSGETIYLQQQRVSQRRGRFV